MTHTASCPCGQLSITLSGEHRGQGICHCLACQSRTGSVFAAIAGFSAPVTITGTSTVYERTGDAGSTAFFHFCPVCGSTVFHFHKGYEDRFVGVAVGCLRDPNFPAPMDSVYDCRRHSWVQLPPGIAVFAKDPPD